MPQLDWTTYPSQLFWLFVIFCALWAVMAYGALPPLQHILKKRQETVADLLSQAQQLQSQADQIEAESQRALEATRRLCEKQIQDQLHEHHALLKKTKEEEAALARHQLREIERTMAQLKKEALEESLLVLPSLEGALLKRLGDIYSREGGPRHVA